jgi:hypothetical protein
MTLPHRLLGLLLAFCALCFVGGCDTFSESKLPKGVKGRVPMICLEDPNGDASAASPLPLSGVKIPVDPSAVFTALDFEDVKPGGGGMEGTAILFKLDGSATIALQQITSRYRNLRLVLYINEVPLSQYRIKGPISNGLLPFFPEVLEDEKATLIKDLKATCAMLQKTNSTK